MYVLDLASIIPLMQCRATYVVFEVTLNHLGRRKDGVI